MREFDVKVLTLILSFAETGALTIVECIDLKTKKPVHTLCAVAELAGVSTLIPLAKLFEGNPYDEVGPASGTLRDNDPSQIEVIVETFPGDRGVHAGPLPEPDSECE